MTRTERKGKQERMEYEEESALEDYQIKVIIVNKEVKEIIEKNENEKVQRG